jgi:hypothetical protein
MLNSKMGKIIQKRRSKEDQAPREGKWIVSEEEVRV